MAEQGIYDTVVVGAGIGGLAAARRLKRAGWSVVVLEAKNRVGGRMLSVPIAGRSVEIGGRWTGPGQDRIKSLAAEYGIDTYEPKVPGASVVNFGGERKVSIPKTGRWALADIAPEGEMLAAIARVDAMANTLAPDAPWLAAGAREWDRLTASAWLAANLPGPIASFIGRVLEGFLPEAHEASLLHALFYLRSNGGLGGLLGLHGKPHDNDLFVGGAAKITDALAAELGDAVVLSNPVHRISQSPNEALVEASGGSYRASHVICALPPVLAGRIDFSPAMPPARDYFTQRFPIRGKFSACLAYSEPFWRREGLSGKAICAEFTSWDPGGDGPGTLALLVGIETSRRLWNEDASERRRIIVDAVAQCFGAAARDPIGYAEVNWAAEPYIRGCNSYAPPGTWSAHGPAWRAPVGRIHWVGAEYAPMFLGQMEGALRSAEDTVSKMLSTH
jgi:monoamine oxidase